MQPPPPLVFFYSELVKAESLGRLHYTIELADGGDLTRWRVKLPPAAFDEDLPGGRALREDLRRLEAETRGAGGFVLLEVLFPGNAASYPTEPFKLRVLVRFVVAMVIGGEGWWLLIVVLLLSFLSAARRQLQRQQKTRPKQHKSTHTL